MPFGIEVSPWLYGVLLAGAVGLGLRVLAILATLAVLWRVGATLHGQLRASAREDAPSG